MKWLNWYERIDMNNHLLFKNATFIHIGKDTDATSLVEKYDSLNKNVKTKKKNEFEAYRDCYYYVGIEATCQTTNSIRDIMISRKGFLIKDKTNDTLILPIYCNNQPTYDDESVGEIIGLNQIKILDEYFESEDIFGYNQKGYLVYPLPENYQNLEYIEGDLKGDSSIDFSYHVYNMIHFTIKLHDLELVAFDLYEAFIKGIYIQENCVISDYCDLDYNNDYHEVKIENIHIDYLTFDQECFVPKNQFINCFFETIYVENENVHFDKQAFVNCTCDEIKCYSKNRIYFEEIFPDAYFVLYD